LPSDTGDITHMGEINGALHLIGDSAIYRVQLADEIDPERTNVTIPNIYQKVLSYGTECLFVIQTLMTARRLFKDNVLDPVFDCKTGINLSFEVLLDMAAMHDIIGKMRDKLKQVSEEMKNIAADQRSVKIPSVGDVRGEAKAFLQKADHVTVTLFNITKLFYGDAIGPRWFESLHNLVSEKYKKDSPFTKFLGTVLPLLKFVRNARNAIEHPDKTKGIKVIDILLLPNGEFRSPSIEIIHPETPQSSVSLLGLMEQITDQLATAFEIMLVHLCDVNIKSFASMPLIVTEYDENQQKAFKCRYGYASRIGNKLIPFG
jgi:hypothetical protein